MPPSINNQEHAAEGEVEAQGAAATQANIDSSFSVKQLKQMLTEKGLKHSDCIEKKDLIQRLKADM